MERLNLRLASTLLLVVVLAAWPLATPAGEVVIAPLQDTTLYEENGAASNGAGAYLFAGNTGQNNTRRALLKFDIAGVVPAGSTITAVQLALAMTRSNSATAQAMDLHLLLQPWGEAGSDAAGNEGGGAAAQVGDATWLFSFYATTGWFLSGGYYQVPASATSNVGGIGTYAWSGPGLVADVQNWLDGAVENNGWILRGNEGQPGTAKRFNSGDNASLRPALTITFTAPIQDRDGDGVADADDNCPDDHNVGQLDTDDDGIGDACDDDDDNDTVLDVDEEEGCDLLPDCDADGIGDADDAFPLDEDETVDSDGDGTGDNADTDDDNDQVLDVDDNCRLIPNPGQEDADGDGIGDACPFDLDIDGNGVADALTDGLLSLRYLFGFQGDALVAGAVGDGATRDSAPAIVEQLDNGVASGALDVDGNGTADALTDGLLVLRYLFGFSGDALIAGAVGDNATRFTAPQIEAYLLGLEPEAP